MWLNSVYGKKKSFALLIHSGESFLVRIVLFPGLASSQV